MHDIKFRAWDKISTKWAYCGFGLGDAVGYVGDCTFSNAGFGSMELESIDVDRLNKGDYILEQFTGLHDKNGKEIYEGDIITDGESSGKIWWRTDLARWACSPDIIMFDRCEVIGNIHENHDVLN